MRQPENKKLTLSLTVLLTLAVLVVVQIGANKGALKTLGTGDDFSRRTLTENLEVIDPAHWVYAVSPDGQWLVYGKKLKFATSGRDVTVVIRNLRTHEDRALETPMKTKIHDHTSYADIIVSDLDRGVWVEGILVVADKYQTFRIDPANHSFEVGRTSRQQAVPPDYRDMQKIFSSREGISGGRPAIAWDGESFGEFIYLHGGKGNGGKVLRAGLDGRVEEVLHLAHKKDSVFVHEVSVSPDGRFLAFTATYQIENRLNVFWLWGGRYRYKDHLFVHDVFKSMTIDVGQVHLYGAPLWAADSRKFTYYENSNPDSPSIQMIELNAPPQDLGEQRQSWSRFTHSRPLDRSRDIGNGVAKRAVNPQEFDLKDANR